MNTLNIVEPIFLQQKGTQLRKPKHPNQRFFPRIYFMHHTNVEKAGLVFVTTLCSQHEELLPIFMQNQRNHPIQINARI